MTRTVSAMDECLFNSEFRCSSHRAQAPMTIGGLHLLQRDDTATHYNSRCAASRTAEAGFTTRAGWEHLNCDKICFTFTGHDHIEQQQIILMTDVAQKRHPYAVRQGGHWDAAPTGCVR